MGLLKETVMMTTMMVLITITTTRMTIWRRKILQGESIEGINLHRIVHSTRNLWE